MTRHALRFEQHREAIFPAYQTAINEYLRRFNAGFRLDRVTSQNIRGGTACTYNVLINNQPLADSGVAAAPGQTTCRTTISAATGNTLRAGVLLRLVDQDPQSCE